MVEQAQLEYPPVLTEMEVHRLIEEQSRLFQMQGGNLEDYLKSVNKTEEQLHEELHPLATRRIARSLVLDKVAEEEKVEVNESDVDTEIENMLKTNAENREELQKALNTPQSRESLKQILMTRKTVNRLVEIAQSSNINTEAVNKEEGK